MKTKTIVAIVVLALFVAVLISSMLSNASQFGDFETAVQEQRTLHVIGRWVNKEKAVFKPEDSFNSFFVQDTNRQVMEVHFYDALAGDMSAADKLDIVGKYDENKGVFVAQKIHMKCPSKYNEGGGASPTPVQNVKNS
jgi:cytochrome c-type biogenesis protein CcmE